MVIVKNSNDRSYEYVIVGSGLAALGAAMALEEKGVNYCIVGRDFNSVDVYPNQQLITSSLFGGASNYWHGVIPLRQLKSDLSRSLFERFYDVELSGCIENKIFIPRRPIRSKEYFCSDRVIVEDVCSISEQDGQVKILLSSDQELFARKVVIACGVRATGDLLLSSSLIQEQGISIDDHVCGYVGLMSLKDVERICRKKISTSINREGYEIESILDESAGILYTFRPAHFEMLNKEAQLRGGPVYGKGGKLKAIFEVVRSFKLGRLMEAVSLKTGIWFRPKYVSVHFQAQSEKVHIKDSNAWKISQENYSVLERVKCSSEKIGFSITDGYSEQSTYFGNHLFNLSYNRVNSNIWDNISIVDASSTQNIGGYHHSFSQLVIAYKKLIKDESS